MLCCIRNRCHQVVVFSVVKFQQRVDSTKILSLAFGLRWTKIDDEYMLKGSLVFIPYSCSSANSTNKSFFKFNGIGRLCKFTEFSCCGVNFNLNSVLLPMCKLCLAKLERYFTKRCSTWAFSSSLEEASSQLNFDKIFLRV